MKTRELEERWNRYWRNYASPTLIGRLSMDLSIQMVRKVLKRIQFSTDMPILEIGCGSGRTLGLLKNWGYQRAIGIDYSFDSIELCRRNNLKPGREVLLMDAEETGFPNNSFPLIFAEGVLEHFTDFTPIVREMCRISSRYVLITQPNHYSPLGRLSHLLQEKLRDNMKEYSYHWQDFRDSFALQGFQLLWRKNTLLGDVWILLFQKRLSGENASG